MGPAGPGRHVSVKRFWKEVEVADVGGCWSIQLDGRAVRTPARAPLSVPNDLLAEAIANEWCDVADEIDPRAMPLTGLANAAIDRVAPDRQAFAAGLARYAEADLACYRADNPKELVERQVGGLGRRIGLAAVVLRCFLLLALARAHDLALVGELHQELAPEIGDDAALDDDLLFPFAPGGHPRGRTARRASRRR